MSFESPEAAAMSTFPAKYCRVVASRAEGDHAYVLLDTGSDGRRYLYGVTCFRQDGKWLEGGSCNGPCWSRTGDGVGMQVTWGEAPPGVKAVRLRVNGNVVDIPVNDGIYFEAWFGVRLDDDFRIEPV